MRTSFMRTMIFAILPVLLTACEKDFDIELEDNQPQLIVEGYINNESPLYNYVVLTRSTDYYTPGLANVPVSGATIFITEGELLPDHSYRWNSSSRVQLREANLPQLPAGYSQGFYFDPRLVTDSANALKGIPGKHYLLEIEDSGRQYSAITALQPPVLLDSISSGFYFVDDDDTSAQTLARITVHYQDPDTLGNSQLFYWRSDGNRESFGWGALGYNRFLEGTDDLINGQYVHTTLGNGFTLGEFVEYYMVSVERKVYNFWESYRQARNNEGPFATPVRLASTIQGENVIGCFSGFSVSRKDIIIR